MQQLKWMFLLMTITLVAIIGFQAYWLKDSYAREKQNLEIKTSAAFRQTILSLQASKLKSGNVQTPIDSIKLKTDSISAIGIKPLHQKKKSFDADARNVAAEAPITIANLVQQKMSDSALQPHIKTIVITLKDEGSFAKIDSSSSQLVGFGSVQKSHSYMMKVLPAEISRPKLITRVVKRQADSMFQERRDTSSLLFGISQSVINVNDSLTHNWESDTMANKSNRIFIIDKKGMRVQMPFQALNPARISSIRVLPAMPPALEKLFDSSLIEKKPPELAAKKKSVPAKLKKLVRQEIKKDTSGKEYNIFYDIDSFRDSLKISEIDSAFARRLNDERIALRFSVIRMDSVPPQGMQTANEVTLAFGKPVAYHYSLLNTFPFILTQMKLPAFFSVFLIGITLLSFWLLYSNILKQQRLAHIKNEFVNNVTHELKTPIATVSVALEALKNFNAMKNPERTKDYLDISSNEMNRLSMLVDKVLALSVFEKQKPALNAESVDLKRLVEEVAASLKPQLEKHEAIIQIEGNAVFHADPVQFAAVIFNLLDNAIKYSDPGVMILINLKENDKEIMLTVTDNGIGIPAEYKQKIFETFFRVPHGDTHNAKGHGLGLSYVSAVVEQHHGTIKAESRISEGTAFIITLPKQAT